MIKKAIILGAFLICSANIGLAVNDGSQKVQDRSVFSWDWPIPRFTHLPTLESLPWTESTNPLEKADWHYVEMLEDRWISASTDSAYLKKGNIYKVTPLLCNHLMEKKYARYLNKSGNFLVRYKKTMDEEIVTELLSFDQLKTLQDDNISFDLR